MLDVDALRNKQTLRLRYVSTRNYNPALRQQKVSEPLAKIILLLAEDGDFNMKHYNALSANDKDKLLHFADLCHLDIGIDSTVDYKMQLDVTRGQIDSGNAHAKQQFVNLVHRGIETKRLSAAAAFELLNGILVH